MYQSAHPGTNFHNLAFRSRGAHKYTSLGGPGVRSLLAAHMSKHIEPYNLFKTKREDSQTLQLFNLRSTRGELTNPTVVQFAEPKGRIYKPYSCSSCPAQGENLQTLQLFNLPRPRGEFTNPPDPYASITANAMVFDSVLTTAGAVYR